MKLNAFNHKKLRDAFIYKISHSLREKASFLNFSSSFQSYIQLNYTELPEYTTGCVKLRKKYPKTIWKFDLCWFRFWAALFRFTCFMRKIISSSMQSRILYYTGNCYFLSQTNWQCEVSVSSGIKIILGPY